MHRPRYTLTDADIGREYDGHDGIRVVILGWSRGKVRLRWADGKRQRVWRTAVEAWIDNGLWELADRGIACMCGQPKGRDVQACDACRRAH